MWQDTLDGMRELLARAAARAARGGGARHCVRCQVPLLAWEAREQQLGMCSCCLVEHARSLAAREPRVPTAPPTGGPAQPWDGARTPRLDERMAVGIPDGQRVRDRIGIRPPHGVIAAEGQAAESARPSPAPR